MEFSRSSTPYKSSPPNRDASQSSGTSDGLNIMGSLREEQEEKQRLEKSNFDLKMKVYYLEESLKRLQDGEQMHDVQAENLKLDLSKMKLQLEERTIDLEQRNLLLIKSKNAIEALKTEIERLRAENEHHGDLEDRVKRLKQLNEDVETDYKGQIIQLEQQLSSTRQQLDAKEAEKANTQDKVSHLELSCEHIDSHLRDAQIEKQRLQDSLTMAQQKIQILEEEVTQGRAQVDLYRIQEEEAAQERDMVKEKLRHEQVTAVKAEEDFKERLHDCSKQYEFQIQTMRQNHEQDLDKMRAGHLAMLTDVRENYNQELEKTKEELERNMGEVKKADTLDLTRVKDNFTQRIDEKNEEIKSLRNMMATDSQRMDSLLQELDSTRQELKQRTQQCEGLLVESTAKSEELKIVPMIKSDLEECRQNLANLQAAIKQEQMDKVQLSSLNQQSSTTLETTAHHLKETEAQLQAAQMENARLSREITDLNNKVDGIELVSRDNERLKSQVARLETEQLGLTHNLSEVKRDLERAIEEGQKITEERESVKSTLRSVQSKLDGYQDQAEAVQIQTQSERERRSAAEAALTETRSVLNQVRAELQTERGIKVAAEARCVQLEDETREMKKSLGHACVMTYGAMGQWDDLLTGILDGDVFGAIPKHMGPFGPGPLASSFTPTRSMGGSPVRHGGGVSSSILLNGGEESGAEILTLPPDQLLQRVAVCIERVGLKLQRTEKIRQLFASQAEKFVEDLQQAMTGAHEKVTLYQHKLTDTQAQLQQMATTVQRDRKQREEETRELKQFKEVVLGQHTTQIRDSELRFAQVTQDLEHEKQRSDELQRQVATQSEELRSHQQASARMQEDLENLERTERIVADLGNRVQELADTNKAQQREIESKGGTIMELTKENNDFLVERSTLIARSDTLMQKLRSKEDAIEESESKLQGLMREIERLRSRQIHPELAKTILDTQSILQNAVRGTPGGGGGGGRNDEFASMNNSPTFTRSAGGGVAASSSSIATAAGDVVGEYLQKISQLERTASDLIARSAQMVADFDAHMGGSARVTRGAAAVAGLKQDIYDLLEANSRLAVQVQQAVSDFRKYGVRQLEQLQDRLASSSSSATAAAAAVSEEGATATAAGAGDRFYFPSRRGLMTPASSAADATAGVSVAAGLEDLRLESTAAAAATTPLNRYGDSTAAGLSSSARYGAYGAGGTSSSSFTPSRAAAPPTIAPRSASVNPPIHTSASTAVDFASLRPVPYGSSGYIGGASSYNGINAGSMANYASYTPNTAQRVSSHRLSTLSSTLEAMAHKLDAYDTSQPK